MHTYLNEYDHADVPESYRTSCYGSPRVRRPYLGGSFSCLGKCKPFPERVTQWARGQITNPTVALLIITKEASHFIDKQCGWLIDM